MPERPSAFAVPLLLAAVLSIASGDAIGQERIGLRRGIDYPALDSAPARASTAFAEFTRENGGTWWTRWCPATGTPSEIFGTGLPIHGWRDTLDDARRQANAVLVAYGDLLGTSAGEFRESIGTSFGNVYTFKFDQFHRGVPVIGGRADVRINKVGRVAFFGSRAFAVPADQAVVPVIASLEAEANAWAAFGKLRQAELAGAPRVTRLVLWGDVDSNQLTTAVLCWEVPVDAVDKGGNGPIGRYYVDATTGAVLHYTNDKHDCRIAGCTRRGPHDHSESKAPTGGAPVPTTVTVMGWARDGNSTTTTPTNVPMAGLEIVVPGNGTVVTDANGQFTVNIATPTNVNVVMNGIHHQLIAGGSAVSQAATLQPGVPATIQVLTSAAAVNQLAHTTCALWTHRLNEWARVLLGNSPELNTASLVQPTVNIANTCNAYYTNNTINFYAAGGNCNNTTSASIIAHEWGHLLDDRYGGISQTHGLSEGWGDTLSLYLLDDPIVAEGFYLTGAGLRDGRNTTLYPPPAQVHAAGEVWMGFAWHFRENLRANLGTPAAIAISDAVVVGSIAADATDQPAAVIQVFIADDNDGNLTNGVPHYTELEAACLTKNLPYPVRQLGTVTTQALADTLLQLQPREVLVTATPNLGTFTQVNLFYNDGAPHQVAMIPAGVTNQYRALLPGFAAPATVTWHVEAAHSSVATVRSPAVGEHRYEVYGLSRFYFDDLESGGAGWTHFSTLGVDDWEIGTPLGLGAPGWTDPAAAYSGSFCAGTDLTIDGAYAPSSERVLRSPVIDCTGRQGVRLRYKRWLTVDSIAQADIAIVRCNGLTFWINAPTGLPPIIDNGWVDQELRLTNADNNPAVVIEWYLRTGAAGAFGGWHVDDVELLTTSLPVPLPNTLEITPAMAVQNAAMTVSLRTALPSSPFLIAVGTTAGPTLFPSVPPIEVGNIFVSVGGTTNGSGTFNSVFQAPAVALTGLLLRYQALTLDGSAQIVTTNPTATLFTQ